MADKRLKILFLTPRFLYPVIGGDRLKPSNVVKHLASKHDVTLVSFFQGGTPPAEYVNEVEKLGVELITIPLSSAKAGARSLCQLHKTFPLEISYYTQPEYKKVVDKLLAERNYDLAFAFFMRTAEYLKDKKIKKILMAEDCRTLYQKRSYEESSNIKQKMIRFWEYHKLKKYEPEIVNHFDITTLVTHDDIAAMQKQNDKVRYELMTNGTDVHKFCLPDDTVQRAGIFFSGKLDIWANQLMLDVIVNKILPLVRKQIPGVKLNIVGAAPPQSVLDMKGEGIEIISNVPEMYPYLQAAELFIHPHSGGSGIQNKLLEAMACGCPVVTTPTGNQGINGTHGEHLMIGKNNEELAQHVVKVLGDKEFAKHISLGGRDLIEKTHSWEVVFQDVDNIIDSLID